MPRETLLIRAIIAFSGATIVRHGYYRLPTRVFVVLPNSGHVTNEGALAEFVYYNLKSQKVTVTFYIQRYRPEDFVVDSSLQNLMNQ